MSDIYTPQMKDVVWVDIDFYDKKTGEMSNKGARPCVVMKVEDDQVHLRTLTSQIKTYPANKHGVLVEKDDVNKLKKDSAVLCTSDNYFSMSREEIGHLEKSGEISTAQMLDVMRKSVACNRMDIQLRKSVQKSGSLS
ncbi:type II toxin-antitoxin system PemK/MazF family toxin [Halobacillus sp. ACCC02827]|uniref:type II toxin-antitoxin system PemK/MazF family toxin n=1 Tax=Bacillaceae TaxID=186817 RepID=UPI000407A4EE|nr:MULTISPECIES: type II toxin-antitoxin system PemK/MazF family toxin [Bacillaceae]QHT48440.1 hypothetical protein M662_18755 [Bacillus sp. SB49]WJE15674.1 type II toxin-antitoxin system PemK/MazF family toxin [Halobacillus sp. ACCC02827]